MASPREKRISRVDACCCSLDSLTPPPRPRSAGQSCARARRPTRRPSRVMCTGAGKNAHARHQHTNPRPAPPPNHAPSTKDSQQNEARPPDHHHHTRPDRTSAREGATARTATRTTGPRYWCALGVGISDHLRSTEGEPRSRTRHRRNFSPPTPAVGISRVGRAGPANGTPAAPAGPTPHAPRPISRPAPNPAPNPKAQAKHRAPAAPINRQPGISAPKCESTATCVSFGLEEDPTPPGGCLA